MTGQTVTVTLSPRDSGPARQLTLTVGAPTFVWRAGAPAGSWRV